MNAEFTRIAHEFARSHRLHPTDVQALVEILDGRKAEALAEGREVSPEPEPVTPGLLAERLNLTSGAVTACLGRLERAGHVRRERDAMDRRVVHVHYELRGMEVAREFFAPLARGTESALHRFDGGELEVVARFLAAMNEELTAVRASAEAEPPE
ncbi:MarR family winged helix-turn-helix transcriptional regulator [Streptomyces meridianus]|uniref:MarR family transcriptional regulator n=1 Tax=Streptomyces meridianus TaxID=2938945 RepID=A0ABT0XB47_9ACTN|nr:MarR family transcriptional regulator [Streptomyces meridianus]MCM2578957.1 MarR family transcriptional regulator [Streptomyces meridianus]